MIIVCRGSVRLFSAFFALHVFCASLRLLRARSLCGYFLTAITAASAKKTARGELQLNMKLVHGILICLLAFSASAQTVFQKHFSQPVEYFSFQQTADSGFVLAGSKWNSGTVYDFCAVRIDENGSILWSKDYPSANDDFLSSVKISGSADLIFFGYSSNSNGDNDLSVMKTSSGGVLLWHSSYGNTNMELMVSGSENTSGEILFSGNRDTWDEPVAMKANASGNIIWEKTFGTTGTQERAVASLLTEDGGMAIAGEIGSALFLLKLDLDGNQQWMYEYGSVHPQFISSIYQTSDKGFVLSSTDYRCDTSGCFPFISFFKTDSLGNIVWAKAVEGFYGWGKDGTETSDGGFVFTGQIQDSVVIDKGAFLIKVNSNGDLLWAKSYGNTGIAGEGYYVRKTFDGGFAIAGTENSQLHFIKTDANGNSGCSEQNLSLLLSDMNISKTGSASLPPISISDFSFTHVTSDNNFQMTDSLICFGLGVDEHNGHPPVNVWPNPFSESAGLTISNIEQGISNVELKIFDVFGKEVNPSVIRNSESFVIRRGGIPAGVYFIQLSGPEKIIGSAKILIQ